MLGPPDSRPPGAIGDVGEEVGRSEAQLIRDSPTRRVSAPITALVQHTAPALARCVTAAPNIVRIPTTIGSDMKSTNSCMGREPTILRPVDRVGCRCSHK